MKLVEELVEIDFKLKELVSLINGYIKTIDSILKNINEEDMVQSSRREDLKKQ